MTAPYTVLPILLSLAGLVAARSVEPEKVEIFCSGEGGYHTYRIPAAVTDLRGTVLAFCEGRKLNGSDTGDIDLLLRRSTDGGRTWGQTRIVWDDGPHTCGNPCPVLDRTTGTLWLLLTWNSGHTAEKKIQAGFGEDSRRVFVTRSTDSGATWAAPAEITAQVKRPEWTWYATGPGAGIQLERGPHAGRLLIPCDHKLPGPDGESYWAHVIYSDDHGTTWQLGGNSPADKVNECEVVELADSRLMLNMRNYDSDTPRRQVSWSRDGGGSWQDQRHEPAHPDPICQASLRRLRWPGGGQPGVLLFSNPADEKYRQNLTIRASLDDGLTWPIAKLLEDGPSAYSCLCTLADDNTAGCLYESGRKYDRITFARFPLDWLGLP